MSSFVVLATATLVVVFALVMFALLVYSLVTKIREKKGRNRDE